MTTRGISRRILLAGAPVVGVTAAVGAPAAPALAAAAGPVATPADFQAAGDGVADDTAALNRALAQARVLDFGGPDRIYRVTADLIAGQATPQFLVGTGAIIRFSGAKHGPLRLKAAAHQVSGLAFEGIDPAIRAQAGGKAIIVEDTAPGSRIEGCRFTDLAESAILVNPGAVRTRIAGCLFQHCGHRPPLGSDGKLDTSFVATLRIAADYTTLVDSHLLDCDWGVYFRGQPEISYYECSGNLIVAGADATGTSQGVSNGRGRSGRIENNTIVGFVDNSIDCYGCTGTTIVGNTTEGGKDGVFIGDEVSVGNTITGNVFRRPQRGVRILAGDPLDRSVTGTVVSGNVILQPTDGGILVQEDGTAQVSGTIIADNRIDLQDNAPGDFGIKVVGAEVTRITGNHVYRSHLHGIRLEGADIAQISGNIVQDPGYGWTNAADKVYDGVSVTTSNRVVVKDTVVYGSARWAVDVATGSGMTVTGTRWRATQNGVNLHSGVLAADNVGW
ncbi:right-handed parallel beta-helix repeat-containing protein [Paractinoplanes durhamensis]|uniref:right-handed parallel beta-helix repeat-containing protein n=1 Tax=Paractinoplanes durhamensis TaxID=113563 RepID=UPI001942E628|nr:right-handed parallel beta-helix repeat-containing protein [Actinoplanes durhamensis]